MVIITAGPPLGVQLGGRIERRLINRSGSTMVKGHVLALDISLSDVASTSFQLGSTASGFVNAVKCLTAPALADGTAILAMSLETPADDEEGLFLLYGEVPEGVIINDGGADNDCLPSDKLIMVNNTFEMDCNQAANGRICGHSMVTASTDVVSTRIPLLFNGIEFLGLA